MARMEIDLALRGMDSLEQAATHAAALGAAETQMGSRLGLTAKEMREQAAAAKRMTTEYDYLGRSVDRLTAMYRELGRTAEGIQLPSAPEGMAALAGSARPSRRKSQDEEEATHFFSGPRQRLQKVQEQLAAAERQGEGLVAADLRDLEGRLLDQIDRKDHPAQDRKGPGFLTGPNQRLAQINEQRTRALALPEDDKRRQPLLKDLDILQFRAERSRRLGEKRLNEGEGALNTPGLLELFRDMNGLLRGLQHGDPGAIIQSVGRGIQLLRERSGGLNVEQKAARLLTPPTPASPRLLNSPNVPGTAPSASLAGAGLLAGEGATLALGGVAVAGALALAAVELHIFTTAVKDAAARANELRDAGLRSGGSPGEVSRLSALGLSPGEVPGLAGGLRERLSVTGGNPFAMMAGMRAGIGPQLPTEYGGRQDNAAIYEKALGYLHSLGQGELQLSEARKLQMENILPLVNVSERLWIAQQRLGQAEASVFGQQAQADAAELAGQQRRLQQEWGLLFAGPGSHFIRNFADGLDGVNNLLERAASISARYGDALHGLLDLQFPLIGFIDTAAWALGRVFGTGDKKRESEGDLRDRHTDAIERQIAATDRNTAAYYKVGFLRGEDRTRRIVPSGIGQENEERAVELGAIRRGKVIF